MDENHSRRRLIHSMIWLMYRFASVNLRRVEQSYFWRSDQPSNEVYLSALKSNKELRNLQFHWSDTRVMLGRKESREIAGPIV